MKSQWKRYQALELIPESVVHPKRSILGWLTAPIRRPFANVFVRELSPKHQVLLFKRCLGMTDLPLANATSVDTLQPSDQQQHNAKVSLTGQHLTQQQHLTAQQWLNRGGLPWWTWYDA
jgi:hypothetical protein